MGRPVRGSDRQSSRASIARRLAHRKGQPPDEPHQGVKVKHSDPLTRVTPENRHDLVEWGPPVGGEAW